MVTLEEIDEKKFKKVLDMKLPPEQSRFVAPNVVSLAQAWLFSDEARPFAVCDDGEVVGFIMLDWDEGERTAGVWRFMIAHEKQHMGYGRAALEAAIRLASDSDAIDLMHLDYVPGNDVARSLYYSLGFRENGDIEDGEIVMTLPLTDSPKVGRLTADLDDLDELLELASGTDGAPKSLTDRDRLAGALDGGEVTRFTVMGDTCAVALDGEITVFDGYEHLGGEIAAAEAQTGGGSVSGACGFCCSSCPTFKAGECRGCAAGHAPGDCPTRDCSEAKGGVRCTDCAEFPCDLLLDTPRSSVLDKDWLRWLRKRADDRRAGK